MTKDKIFSDKNENNHKPEVNLSSATDCSFSSSGSPSGDVCECGHKKEEHAWDIRFKVKEDCLRCRCKKFKPKKSVGEGEGK
jgi:hypothetical protein